MKKFIVIFATIGAVILVGCTHSPGHRIAECEKKGGSEAACTAAEWDYEKVNPLPTFDTRYDPSAVLQSSLDAPRVTTTDTVTSSATTTDSTVAATSKTTTATATASAQ